MGKHRPALGRNWKLEKITNLTKEEMRPDVYPSEGED